MILIALIAASGDSKKLEPDAGPTQPPIDAPADPPVDLCAPDPSSQDPVPDSILDAHRIDLGTTLGLMLPICGVTVTSVRPQIENATNPAGFTVQTEQLGLGLFVAIDPTTLSPPPSVGDVVKTRALYTRDAAEGATWARDLAWLRESANSFTSPGRARPRRTATR